MRAVQEREAWISLKKSYAAAPPKLFAVGDSAINLAAGCTVIAGKNGTGKSRLLRDIHAADQDGSLLLDMHHLSEQALAILRSRADLDAMVEEFDSLAPDDARLDDVQRVVGRRYESVAWYALEIAPPDPAVAARFRWSGTEEDEPLVPFFRVQYKSLAYTSKDMGLGEFSTHFMFWILEQYREVENLTLLLDEPDAYLPPIGVERLLARLLDICLRRRWRVIISTHSEEMIARALEEDSLTVLRVDDSGSTVALHSNSTPDVAMELLSRPPTDAVLFVEDESACYLTRALLDAHDARLSGGTVVIWGEGHGYLRELHKSIPRPPRSEVKFGYVLDGDQRGTVEALQGGWPAVFLPTGDGPDTLFQTAALDPAALASRLGADLTSLTLLLDAIEAHNSHDWVDALGERYGRPNVLRALATLWTEANPGSSRCFVDDLRTGWRGPSVVGGM